MVLDDNVSLCTGETAQLSVSGGLIYEWTDPNGTLSATDIPNPIASPSSSTTYNVVISDNCPNNMASFDIIVNVNASPIANAGPDTCVIQGQLFELSASGGTSYIWDNQQSIEGPFAIPNPIISIDTATVFTVTVIDNNGCVDTDEVEVCIIEDPTDLLDAVTMITPNGDGRNDELVFRGLESFPDNKLTIFNRWGNIIYEKIGYQRDDARWNGLRDGVELPPDTYYYILEFAGTKIKTSLTILRD
jgi:gliding motility-associated-like protein